MARKLTEIREDKFDREELMEMTEYILEWAEVKDLISETKYLKLV